MSEPLKDKLGRLFDRLKFKPEFDALGRWKNARAGRKKGKTLSTKSPTKTPAAKRSPMSTTPETPSLENEGLTAEEIASVNEIRPPVKITPEATAEAARLNAEEAAKPDFSDVHEALSQKPTVETLAADLEEIAVKGSTPTAETIIGIIQTILVLIGEEEGILTDGEKIILRPSLQRVLKKYNVGADVLPAEVDLIVAVAGLVITRLKKPKTALFAAKVRQWAINMWMGRKGRTIQRVVERENPSA